MTKGKTSSDKIEAIIVGVLIAIIVMYFRTNTDTDAETNVDTIVEKETDYFVTAQEYYQEFMDNEVRAGLKYKDKVIEIKGEVEYLISENNGFVVFLDAGWLSSVTLKFPESERYEFSSNYNKGDFLSAKCFGTAGSSTLENCELK